MTIKNRQPICLQPKYFSRSEGGHWLRWPVNLPLYPTSLPKKGIAEGNMYVVSTMHGDIAFHSVIFGESTVRRTPRWDCIRGWTTPLPRS